MASKAARDAAIEKAAKQVRNDQTGFLRPVRNDTDVVDDWHAAQKAEEEERLQAALSCGPQCASSVLATRYAKILRQERLLAEARAALVSYRRGVQSGHSAAVADYERAGDVIKKIDEEKGNPA